MRVLAALFLCGLSLHTVSCVDVEVMLATGGTPVNGKLLTARTGDSASVRCQYSELPPFGQFPTLSFKAKGAADEEDVYVFGNAPQGRWGEAGYNVEKDHVSSVFIKLTISALSTLDEGQYICSLKTFDNLALAEDSAEIVIAGLPVVTCPDKVKGNIGDKVSIPCTIVSKPKAMKSSISWTVENNGDSFSADATDADLGYSSRITDVGDGYKVDLDLTILDEQSYTRYSLGAENAAGYGHQSVKVEKKPAVTSRFRDVDQLILDGVDNGIYKVSEDNSSTPVICTAINGSSPAMQLQIEGTDPIDLVVEITITSRGTEYTGSHNYRFSPEQDGKEIKCEATVAGFDTMTATAKLQIQGTNSHTNSGTSLVHSFTASLVFTAFLLL